ncbi:MAG: hypothetical protein MK135_00840 [Polyangiaceae bacterium]|nr:hypothetical protein [Polyangiaceae bacterium]
MVPECSDSGDPCVSDGDCCSEGNCFDEWRLHLNGAATVVATGPAGPADDDQDETLNLNHYVKDGEEHLIIGEFNPAMRAGTAAELAMSFNFSLRDEGESYPLVAVPGKDGGALLLAIHAQGELSFSQKTVEVALVRPPFHQLGDGPQSSFQTIESFTAVDVLPMSPRVSQSFVTLSGVGISQRSVGFSSYTRQGALAVPTTVVYRSESGTVDRADATIINPVLSQTLVTWVETEGGTSEIKGIRYSCQPAVVD